jgi:hypothetical protein
MKKAWKFVVPGVCVFVIIITFNMLYDMQQRIEEENYGTDDIAVEENIIDEENKINSENEAVSNDFTNSLENSQNIIEDDNVVLEQDDKLSTTNQEKAIELVKQYWGEDSTVYFTNEGVNSNGEYTVAVRQKTSTAVKDYFKVNLETKKVEIEY